MRKANRGHLQSAQYVDCRPVCSSPEDVDCRLSTFEDGSLDHPWKTIAQGLQAVPETGKVYVYEGTCAETVRWPDKQDVSLVALDSTKKPVIVAGDFFEPLIANPTVMIPGELVFPWGTTETSLTVTIQGFQISGGRSGFYWGTGLGAGVWCGLAGGDLDLVLKDNLVESNEGAGVLVWDLSGVFGYDPWPGGTVNVSLVNNEVRTNGMVGADILLMWGRSSWKSLLREA